LREAIEELASIATWRRDCHDHDADMGHEPRDFFDDEDWDMVEAFAKRHADKARACLEAIGPLVSGEEDRFWLIVTDPGCVPQRKGPWKRNETRAIIREFMRERPTALIHYLTVDENGVPWINHAREWLGMLDGRSLASTTKHNRAVNEAFASFKDGK
jgi:hypothetical protein